jgi:DNA primase
VFGLGHVAPTFVVVESPLDAVRLHGLGVPAVSTYGAAVSTAQMQLMIVWARKLIIALDNPYRDDAGRTNALRLLKDYGTFGIHFWPYTEDSPKDPGDMTDEEILWGVRHTRSSVRGRRAVLDFA